MLAFIVGWTQLSKVDRTRFFRSNCSKSRISPVPLWGGVELITVSRTWIFYAAFAVLLATYHPLSADDLSGFRVKCFAMKNAKIVKSPGQLIEAGQIVVRDGRVVAIGTDIEIPADAELIDVQGLTIYPGFIDAAASTFLSDEKPIPIEGHAVDVSRYALAGMRPDDHSGLTPEYRASEHLKVTPADVDKFRQAGFVAVNVMPSGRFASGQGCVINLASVPPRDATLSASSFAPIQIMARQRGDGPNARAEYPSTKMGAFAHLRQTFLDAERHARQTKLFAEAVPAIDRPPVDPVLETFTAIRSGQIRTTFVASERDDLDRALTLAAEHQLRITIWGGDEAYKIVDRLKKTETDIILYVDFGDEPKLEPPKPTDPAYPDIPVPKRVAEYKLAQWKERVAGLAALRKSGVRFALSSRDGKAPSDLLKSIRAAIANGLDRDAALASLTSDAAKVLSLDTDLGTIEIGRPAYFVVMTGPFDHEQSKVRYSVINGHRYEYNKDAKPVDTSKSGDQPSLQVAGTWNVEIDSAEGKVTGELELTQTDRTLSGRFQSSKGDGRITSGKVTKDGLEFVVGIGAGDSTISLKFDTVGWTYTPTTPNPPPEKEASPKPAATESNSGTPTELRGNLTSPFGAPTKWSAKRLEPKPISSAGIQLGAIEVESSSPPAVTTQPASALSPANADSTAPLPIDQPVEFPEDRRARPIVTGGNVLIKNGTVLTATGATLRKTSVLVRSGTIVAIGPDLTADEGMTIIDATDRYVMPGIIDTHSHIMISNGRCAFINRAGAETLGYPAEQVIGRNMHYLIHHAHGDGRDYPVDECPIFRAFWQGLPCRIDSEVLWRADGSCFPAEYSSYPIVEGGVVVGAVVTFIDISERKRAEEMLRRANDELELRVEERTQALTGALAQLRELSAYLHSVREEERTRIAREIHDELGSLLVALKMDVNWLGKRVAGDADLGRKLQSMGRMIETAVDNVGRIMTDLRPSILDHQGLWAALEWQAQDFAESSELRCDSRLDIEPGTPVPDDSRAIAVFRIFQEMLSNVARHAQAGAVKIRITARNAILAIEVVDDGCGAPAGPVQLHVDA